ncbi:MAG: hypothetical protein KKH92_06800 [Firmicutes bacterium]|nr:hypothetical protein [Bacillota bacterium]
MGYSNDYILDSITPNKLMRYLKENNWTIIDDSFDSPNYLLSKNDEDFKQLLIPKKKGSSQSYKNIIQTIIYEIALVQQTNEDVIINNIANVDKYVVNIRYANPNVKNSNIPASILYELLENAKKLYLNSYADVNLKDITATPYRRGKTLDQIQNLDGRLEFGQTTTGSYIIPLLIPKEDINFELHDGDIFENQNFDFNNETGNEELLDSNGKAILNMIEKMDLVKSIIDDKEDLNIIIDPSSENFVSVNYLSSLSSIGDESDETIIEFSSTVIKNNDVKNIKSSFSSRYKKKVFAFVEEYKKTNKLDNIFTGKLYKLTVDNTEVIERKTLVVSLEGQSISSASSKIQKLVCEFEYERYKDIIFNAIENGLTVKVEGDRTGNKLSNCSAEIIYK